VANPHGNDDMWIIIDVVEYIFVMVYFDMSSKFVKEYLSWHGWNINWNMHSSSCSQAHILVHKLTLSLTSSLNNNPHHSDVFLKLRGMKTVVSPSSSWMLMMLWVINMKRDLATLWKGEIGEEIIGDQAFQEIVKSTHAMKDWNKIIKWW